MLIKIVHFHSQFFYSHFIYCHLYCNGFEVKVWMVTAAMKIKDASSSLLGRIAMTNLDRCFCIKNQKHHFADKGPSSQSCDFSSSHEYMWKLDHKESWALKNWCFWTVVLEKTLESPLDSKIKPIIPKGNQSWIFIGRTDAEAEAPVLWPSDGKSWLIGKGHDAGKDWGQEEKGVAEDEMVGWHHWLNGHRFDYIQGDSEGPRSLVCFSSWDQTWTDSKSDMT